MLGENPFLGKSLYPTDPRSLAQDEVPPSIYTTHTRPALYVTLPNFINPTPKYPSHTYHTSIVQSRPHSSTFPTSSHI